LKSIIATEQPNNNDCQKKKAKVKLNKGHIFGAECASMKIANRVFVI
jgi:hypothetical protein